MSHRLTQPIQKILVLEIIREHNTSVSLPSPPPETCQPVDLMQFHVGRSIPTCCSTCCGRVEYDEQPMWR
jgi:hypothetical protein